MIEYIRQLQSFSNKQHDYCIQMTDALIKSIETVPTDKDVKYLSGFLKGYQSGMDDVLAKQRKDEELVEIPEKKEEVATPKYSKDDKEPCSFIM